MTFYQKGFTLFELIIVMLIIGIISITLLLQWPSSAISLDAEATQLQNDLRYTQTLSMTKGQRYCLVLSTTSYQIVNSATTTAITLPFGSSTASLGKNISFGTFVPSNLKMIVFDGKGTPYYSTNTTCDSTNAASASLLTSNATIPVTSNGITKSVIISPDTGSVQTQ